MTATPGQRSSCSPLGWPAIGAPPIDTRYARTTISVSAAGARPIGAKGQVVKNFGKILLASTAAIALCGAAHAADLPVYTKAPPLAPAPALVSCTSAVQFIVTDCPLTYYGITVYGTVDMGAG